MTAMRSHLTPGDSPGANYTAPGARWRNELPAWVLASPGFAALPRAARHTLGAIADKADSPDRSAGGHLLNCFGGRGLAAAAGVSLRTLFRHVARLEDAGLIVCTARGCRFNGREIGNVYAIPGSPGALDARRVRRRMQRMVHAGGGLYRPQAFEPNVTPPLFAQLPTYASSSARLVESPKDMATGQPGPAPVPPAIPTPPGQRDPTAVGSGSGRGPGATDPPEPPEPTPADTSCQRGTGARVNLTRPPVSNWHGPPCHRDTGARVNLARHHSPSHSPTHSPSHMGGGGGAPRGDGDEDREMRGRLALLCRWLDAICWRNLAPPARRAELIARDPAHALACREEYRRRAKAIEASGQRVKSPARLFDAIFTGRGVMTLTPGRGDPPPAPPPRGTGGPAR